ncbi:Phospholipase A1 [Zostera marina]|uniref:Phospholipase A1 n=1 Tax=Zostera marina TaxID=29655 RepID=A0A0K9P789_ZOSMR|nr:Phospholipase A1 [Zostera marina]
MCSTVIVTSYVGYRKPSDYLSAATSRKMAKAVMQSNIGVDDTRMERNNTSTARSPAVEVWGEIQGCNNWCKFVKPLHPFLRREIIRYAEIVNINYKSVHFHPCNFANYQVTKHIYIPTCSRLVGFVAVSSNAEVERRDIVVSFRGVYNFSEWIANLMVSLTPARMNPDDPRPEVKVGSGVLGLYTSDGVGNSKLGFGSCREQLLCEIRRLVNLYKDEDVSITLAGHSMGSSLALLFGYDLAELGLNNVGEETEKKIIPITVYSFAGPRVGNMEFKKRCEELGVKVLRVVNVRDLITKLPGMFFNENLIRVFPWKLKTCFFYAHVGVELSLDFFKINDLFCVHDLGHIIDFLSPSFKQDQGCADDGDGIIT